MALLVLSVKSLMPSDTTLHAYKGSFIKVLIKIKAEMRNEPIKILETSRHLFYTHNILSRTEFC